MDNLNISNPMNYKVALYIRIDEYIDDFIRIYERKKQEKINLQNRIEIDHKKKIYIYLSSEV